MEFIDFIHRICRIDFVISFMGCVGFIDFVSGICGIDLLISLIGCVGVIYQFRSSDV